RDDVGHHVAADLTTKRVGGGEHTLDLGAPRREQSRELVLPELAARELQGQDVTADEERRPDGLSRRPGVVARVTGRVGGATHVRGDAWVAPGVEIGHVLRVDRKSRHELEPTTP